MLAEGPTADPNLAGRLDFWSAVTRLNAVYPWGTLGSPELILGTSIDSTWFRAFGQGSVLYVGALALMLLSATLVGGSVPASRSLVAVVVAVAGVTMNPFGYPVIVLFWALLGATLRSAVAVSVAAPRPAGSTRPGPPELAQWPPAPDAGQP